MFDSVLSRERKIIRLLNKIELFLKIKEFSTFLMAKNIIFHFLSSKMYAGFLDIGKVKVNKDENVHRFGLKELIGLDNIS